MLIIHAAREMVIKIICDVKFPLAINMNGRERGILFLAQRTAMPSYF